MSDPPPVIFVVDDDPSVLVAVRRLLRSLRHPVELFGSAEEFLARTDPAARGCVILDVSLPGMSGVELQQRLLTEAWKLPVIFITALDDDDGDAARETAIKRGAVDYLRKPFERERLLRSVRVAMADPEAG